MLNVIAWSKRRQEEVLLAVLILLSYLPIFMWMWERWFAGDSYYAHGILVPLVSLFLVWEKKKDLKKLAYEPSIWSLRLFVLGILIYWISAILHIYFSAAFSLIILLAGLIFHFYGKNALRYLWFPLAFLVFMIPLPLVVVAAISFKLKVLAANLATGILNQIHLPASLQEASLIKMRHTYVVVEDACGGLKSLISLTALGAIFAHQMKGELVKKIIVCLAAIPIAVITNACRIAFLAAVGEICGAKYTQGILHGFSGYLVFTFAFLFLLSLEKLLERI